MHILILSKRNAQAQARLLRAAEALARRLDLDPALIDGLKVNTKDPAVRVMQEREGVAALLEELAYLADALEKPTHAADEADVTAVTEPEGEDPVSGAPPDDEPGEDLPLPVLEQDASASAEVIEIEGEPEIEEFPAEELPPEAGTPSPRKPRGKAKSLRKK
jgi:hypothetical protein